MECIEYKDPENNGRGRNNVYDEIPAEARTNGRTDKPAHPTSTESDPVYSKPVKRESSNQGKADTCL